MSPRQRPFLERLRTFEEVLREVSAGFDRSYRFTPVLDVHPRRVVSIAVERGDLSSKPKVYVPAADLGDVASPEAKADLERRIGDAVHRLGATQLSLEASFADAPPATVPGSRSGRKSGRHGG